MAIGIKFNNPGGTADQIQCENICGIIDPLHGGTERKNVDGVAIDIYYIGSSGKYICTQGMPKCITCPLMTNFFTTLP